MPLPALSVLVLTEDTSESAHKTWVALLKKAFSLLVAGVRTNAIRFEPQEGDARAVMGGNLWRSTRPRDRARQLQLWRTIATKLLEEQPTGVVVFHVDGDTAWSDHAGSLNAAQYESSVPIKVAQVLESFTQAKERQVDVDTALRRLLRVTPFYSVEAWLYQAVDLVRSECARDCGKHLAAIDAWRDDPASIDEVDAPKDFLSCVRDRKNAELAQAFPTQKCLDADASFAACVFALTECSELCDALTRTFAFSDGGPDV